MPEKDLSNIPLRLPTLSLKREQGRDILECELDFAVNGVSIPNLSEVKIAGAPVVALGHFEDALNSSAQSPWQHIGGGKVRRSMTVET